MIFDLDLNFLRDSSHPCFEDVDRNDLHKVKQICNLAEIIVATITWKNGYKCRSALPSSSVLTLILSCKQSSMASCQIPLWHVITAVTFIISFTKRDNVSLNLPGVSRAKTLTTVNWMLNETLKLSTINPGFSSTLFVLETGNSTDSPLLPSSIISTFLDISTNISTCVSCVLVYQDFAHLSPNAISPGLAQNMLDLLLSKR